MGTSVKEIHLLYQLLWTSLSVCLSEEFILFSLIKLCSHVNGKLDITLDLIIFHISSIYIYIYTHEKFYIHLYLYPSHFLPLEIREIPFFLKKIYPVKIPASWQLFVLIHLEGAKMGSALTLETLPTCLCTSLQQNPAVFGRVALELGMPLEQLC